MDIPSTMFTPGDDAYATTFGSDAPNVVSSNLGTVSSYLRPGYLPICFDKLAESGLTATFSRSGCVIRGPDGQIVGSDVP